MKSVQVLPVIALPGLRCEVLGNYLAALGLLRLLARSWPSTRIAWRQGVVQVVGGPPSLDDLVAFLLKIAEERGWTEYKRWWRDKQKECTSLGSGRSLAVCQGKARESVLELFAAHMVPRERLVFNPLFGSGGNAGRRDFAKGWRQAVELLQSAKQEGGDRELKAWLLGEPTSWLKERLAAGSWFSSATKLYNSGQCPYREEGVSPWAMVFACEGVAFFAGSASRRLGVQSRSRGAFPFVCEASSPICPGEAGRDWGEVWAPIWERPMTLAEVRALFARGRAEVGGRGAVTPAAFAAAIVRRGVDAGISGFLRFALGATTSANTFEPRYGGLVPTESKHEGTVARPQTAERVLQLIEKLPRDRKQRKGWQFVGLRGPVERSLIRLAQNPGEPSALLTLLDEVVGALDRVDRNLEHRKAGVTWTPLPLEELRGLFLSTPPETEARLAAALVSGFVEPLPFTLYRFGVERNRGSRFFHPQSPPARWVFRHGSLARTLTAVSVRLALDAERQNKSWMEKKTRTTPITVSISDVQAWLDGWVNEEALALWLGRFALFQWEFIPRWLLEVFSAQPQVSAVSGPMLLVGLLQPFFNFFDRYALGSLGQSIGITTPVESETTAFSPSVARALVGLVRSGQVDAAVQLVAARYAMLNLPLVRCQVPWNVCDPERLLAAMLFPLTQKERLLLIKRWFRPRRT